jgi:hypothetical protein
MLTTSSMIDMLEMSLPTEQNFNSVDGLEEGEQ